MIESRETVFTPPTIEEIKAAALPYSLEITTKLDPNGKILELRAESPWLKGPGLADEKRIVIAYIAWDREKPKDWDPDASSWHFFMQTLGTDVNYLRMLGYKEP